MVETRAADSGDTTRRAAAEDAPRAAAMGGTGDEPVLDKAEVVASGAPNLLLGPLLRHVDATSATIWVETDRPARVTVSGAPAGTGRPGWSTTSPTFTVSGHHYALAVVEGLEPGTTTAYTIEIDGTVVWPESDSPFPPSVIRTTRPESPVSILVGSCRAAAPHEPPYSLELAFDDAGRGVDTLWAHGLRMLGEDPADWPTLLLLVGDQIYADDSSPTTRARIEGCRPEGSPIPPEIVAGYEEYCWLYREAWSPRVERWLLSVIPSAMIFDDHDMIDDWNISESWVHDIRGAEWWEDHVLGGMTSYLVHQHLGNLAPAQLREDGLLDACIAAGDATEVLTRWAMRSEEFTPVPGGYRFSFSRDLGSVKVVVVDCRNGRVLTPNHRAMVDEEEWAWVERECHTEARHLVLATSVPVFIADGLHDLQVWNERVCDGAWGDRMSRIGERVRRSLDLEDWSAFGRSYAALVDLVSRVGRRADPPETILVVSGDIHFSYTAAVPLHGVHSRVHQVVSSPIRNALIPHERGVIRFSLTRAGALIGGLLRRSVRAPRTAPGIEMAAGPFFANNMCELTFDGDTVEVVFEQATPGDDGEGRLDQVARVSL